MTVSERTTPAVVPAPAGAVRFVLNDREVTTAAPGGLTLLDFIRRERGLTGTKEGCKEGDCGACVVLLGELRGAAGEGEMGADDADSAVDYRPVTSCLVPLAEVAGCHVVTIEGLDTVAEQRRASTVQRAIVAAGGSQCGFCTAGIVVSLTALRLQDDPKRVGDVDHALSGHLCRCTGYRSLRDAGAEATAELASAHGPRALVARGELPAYFLKVPQRLRALVADAVASTAGRAGGPDDADLPLVAGGSDLFVQRGEALAGGPVIALNRRRELRGVRAVDGVLEIGALTTFEDLATSPLLAAAIPDLPRFMEEVASWQVRNRATVGGNLVNASPIGDISILLLALDATLVLEDRRDGTRRSLPLRDFYRGYKQLDRRPGELVVAVRLDGFAGVAGEPSDRVGFEKVAKRRTLDIASVNAALRLRLAADGTIAAVGVALGGVAPVPLYLRQTVAALTGRRADAAAIELALETAQREIAPISDIRGAASYKRLLAHQLLAALFERLMEGD